jgi:hypothetical protein
MGLDDSSDFHHPMVEAFANKTESYAVEPMTSPKAELREDAANLHPHVALHHRNLLSSMSCTMVGGIL